MKRWLTTLMMLAVCSAVLRADVTIVQTTSVEGGPAAMTGGAAGMNPKMTTRTKGTKQRSDIEAGNQLISTIADITTRQVIRLHADQKTAQILGDGGVAPAMPAGLTMPKMDASVEPTGRSQTIEGVKCDEYAFTTSMDMGSMSGAQAPPEAAAMLKDVKMLMKGSIWVAKTVPGAAEYIAFMKAAGKADMMSAIAGAMAGANPGLDKIMKAMSSMEGLPYLTEMTMTVEGSGQIADMMKQMGAMKITTKVTSISNDALSDDIFQVPADYKVIKP